MGILSRDAILSADDLPRETVSVPEWGGEVIVRTMTGQERDAWELRIHNSDKTTGNIRAGLCAMVICDENGERVFKDKDIEALGNKSSAALARVFDAAQRLNGFSSESVEELEKN